MKSTSLARRPSSPHPLPQTPPNPPNSDSSPNRPRIRRLSSLHRAFISQFAARGFQDPERAAIAAGLKRPGIGYKLSHRFSDLIEEERLKLMMADQMEIEEALKLLAVRARDASDPKVQLASIQTVLKVQGVLTDKPMPAADRKAVANELEELLSKLRSGLSGVKPGARIRIRAAFEAETMAEAEADGGPALPSPPNQSEKP